MSLKNTEPNNAIASLRKTILENPSDAWSLSRLGEAYQEAGIPQEAIARLHEAIALVPDFPLPYRQLASVYHSLGDSNLAKLYRDKAEELSWKAKIHAELWRLKITSSETGRGGTPL